MSPGKTAAQAGHAFLDSYLATLRRSPEIIDEYKAGHGIKICLAAADLEVLRDTAARALQAGVAHQLITDLGYTQFEGVPTITALGIGPIQKSVAGPICGHLPLLR